jgi:regulator of replication initiation timing
MIALFQSLSAFAGLISMVLLLVVAVFAGRYMTKSGISDASNKAQKSAMDAMHEEITILKGRIEDVKKDSADMKKENMRLQLIMETIAASLKGMGLIVSVEGDLVRIKNEVSSENVVQRVHGTGWPREEDK